MAIFGSDKQTVAQMTADITDGISATIAESVTKAMEPVFEKLAGEISKSLGETRAAQNAAAEALAANIAKLEECVGGLSGAAAELNKSLAEQKQMLTQLAETQKTQGENQAQLAQECEKTLKSTQEIQSQIKETTAEFTGVVKENIGEFSSTIKGNIEEFNSSVKGNIEQFDGAVKTNIDSYGNEIKSSIENFEKSRMQASEDMNRQLSQFDENAKKISEIQSAWLQNIEKADAKLAGDYEARIERLTKSTEVLENYSKAVDAAAKSLESGLAQYNSGMDKGVEDFEKKVLATVSETFGLIDKQLAAAAESLGKTANEIAESAEKIPKAIRGLN